MIRTIALSKLIASPRKLFALATALRQRNVQHLAWDQVDLARRQARIEGSGTKNVQPLGVPLNDLAMAVLERQRGRHEVRVFT